MWPFSTEDGDTATPSPDELETTEVRAGFWEASTVVLSWSLEISGGQPVAGAPDNQLYITATGPGWGGSLDADEGHCTVQRAIDEVSLGDALSGAGASLGTVRSGVGADLSTLGDCARLQMDAWDGSPVVYLSEILFDSEEWLLGIGPSGDVFSQALGDYSQYALGGFSRLGGEDVLTNAVFAYAEGSVEPTEVAGISALPDGTLYAPPWFAVWVR